MAVAPEDSTAVERLLAARRHIPWPVTWRPMSFNLVGDPIAGERVGLK